MTYKQCRLKRQNTIMTSWIPAKFAKKGGYLKLKVDGVWQDGWQIIEVYGSIEEKVLRENEKDYLHQRKASDI